MYGVVNVTRDRCRTVAGFRFKATSGREPRITFPSTVVQDGQYPSKIHELLFFSRDYICIFLSVVEVGFGSLPLK